MRKFASLLSVLMLFCVLGFSQNRIISGIVKDDKGTPLSNVSVLAKGTNLGTTTDANGNYSLSIPSNVRALIFSSVDMTSQEVNIGSQQSVNAILSAANKSLDEVVVIGYGTQRRRETVGNVNTIKGDAIAQKPVQSFESALAGKAPGVQITVPNGILNNPPVFRIRGTNSISLSSQPLIVVDGVPTFTGDQGGTSAPLNPLASINPSDIESIDIAKDAAATAIYGSRAGNGVVFITTKKGKAGKPKVRYDGWVGWSEAIRLPELLNAYEYVEYKNNALANAKANNPTITGSFRISKDTNGRDINTNWLDEVYRKGISHSHTASVSGGSEGTTYYLSLGYSDQEGILKKNDFKRANALFNIDSRINSVVSIGGKLAYSNEENIIGGNSGSLFGEAFASVGSARLALATAPNVAPFKNDGTYNIGSTTLIGPMGNLVNGNNPFQFANPRMIMDLNRSNNENNHLQSNAYLQLKPLSWLTLKTTYGIDNLLIDNDIFYNPFHGDGAGASQGPGGGAFAVFFKEKSWLWTNTAQFDYSFRSKHHTSLLIGNEQQGRTSRDYGINRRTLSDSAYTVIQANYGINNASGMTLGENYLLSSFARLNYNYDRKYFISGNVRQDEYSALGEKKGIFWGVSAGWEVTKERFWETAGLDNVFSSFRLRGSYGKVGNIGGITNYAPFSTYSSGLYGGSPVLFYGVAGNDKLKWETSTKAEGGIVLGLFKDRITGEFTYYNNDIDNLILSVPQAPSTGVPNTSAAGTMLASNDILQNVGTMYNRGFEFMINATPVQSKDFSWTTSLNLTFNKNKVTSLAPGLTEIISYIGGGTSEFVSKTLPGHSLGYLYVVRTAGVDPATGRRIFIDRNGNRVLYESGVLPAGSFNYENPDGTQYTRNGVPSQINQIDDGVLYANSQPKRFGGWDNTIRYKNFDLNFIFTYQGGFSIYYGSNAGLRDQRGWNNSKDVLRYWQKPGDVTDIPKPIYGDNTSNGSAIVLDVNVFKADFVKLRTLQIGYSIPASILSKAKLSQARVYIAGQNLAMFTDYPGPDPEVSTDGSRAAANTTQGIDRNTLANGRTITVGISIGF